MKQITLGTLGIEVSELCFGALPLGPVQKNIPLEESACVIAKALSLGVNFVDTAQLYRTYPQIRRAMDITGVRPVIASKSAAASYEGMADAIEEALSELKIDCVDIFLLHAARADTDVFEVRKDAFRCMLDYKKAGKIKAAGISTHDVRVTALAAANPDVDIIFPIINKSGMGILGGSREDMVRSIELCFEHNKAVYFMKALAGGNLTDDYLNAFAYVREISKGRAPIALGMLSEAEVIMNADYFEGKDVTEKTVGLKNTKRFSIIKSLCKKCGACLEVCHSSAISLQEESAVINDDACLKCGYCTSSCKEFAVRML